MEMSEKFSHKVALEYWRHIDEVWKIYFVSRTLPAAEANVDLNRGPFVYKYLKISRCVL